MEKQQPTAEKAAEHIMNRRPIVIATVIGALGGALAVIIFLYFFHVVEVARLLSTPRTPHPAGIDIDLSPDSEWFLEEKARIERTLRYLSRRGGLYNEIPHHNEAIGPNRARAIAEQDNTIYLIGYTERATVRNLKGHTDSVIRVSFSPDGSTLLSGSMDKTIRLWNTTTGECEKTIPINTPDDEQSEVDK